MSAKLRDIEGMMREVFASVAYRERKEKGYASSDSSADVAYVRLMCEHGGYSVEAIAHLLHERRHGVRK